RGDLLRCHGGGGGGERIDQHGLDDCAPFVLADIDAVRKNASCPDLGVVRLGQQVERLDGADDYPVVPGAHIAADPVARTALVGEDALLDALPVGVLEQAARDTAVRPAAGGHTTVSPADAAQGELQELTSAIALRENSQIVSYPLFLWVHP